MTDLGIYRDAILWAVTAQYSSFLLSFHLDFWSLQCSSLL